MYLILPLTKVTRLFAMGEFKHTYLNVLYIFNVYLIFKAGFTSRTRLIFFSFPLSVAKPICLPIYLKLNC